MSSGQQSTAGRKSPRAVSLDGLRVRPPETPSSPVLAALYNDFLDRPGVQACMIGEKITHGRRTRELALVCAVQNKHNVRRGEKIPPRVTWGRAGRRRELKTDVVVLRSHGTEAGPILGPGDVITGIRNPANMPIGGPGTIGMVIDHPRYGRVITTAAHVLGLQAPTTVIFHPGGRPMVALQNAGGNTRQQRFAGVALKAVYSGAADYALVAPVGPSVGAAANRFRDFLALGRPVIPDEHDVRNKTKLLVLTATGARQTRLRFIEATLPVGPVLMQRTIATDRVTNPGDSGACLVDENLRLWGLLEGFTTLAAGNGQEREYSVFMPAYLLLRRELGEAF